MTVVAFVISVALALLPQVRPVTANAVSLAGGTSLGAAYAAWEDPAASPDAASDELHLAPTVNGRNEVMNDFSRSSRADQWTAPATMAPPQSRRRRQPGYDGTFIYQYDAWNRLVQVNTAAANPDPDLPAAEADDKTLPASRRSSRRTKGRSCVSTLTA